MKQKRNDKKIVNIGKTVKAIVTNFGIILWLAATLSYIFDTHSIVILECNQWNSKLVSPDDYIAAFS